MSDRAVAPGRSRRPFTDRVDPALLPGLTAYQLLGFGVRELEGDALRRLRRATAAASRAADSVDPRRDTVETWDDHTTTTSGHRLRLRVHRPIGRAEDPLPVVYWLHGGGFVLGAAEQEDVTARAIAEDVGCVVVVPDYRLAPEHPHPTPVQDCLAGLDRAAAYAGRRGAAVGRLAVAGTSAGGGLAAAVCLLVREAGGPDIAFQLLVQPMLDDRDVSPSTLEFADAPTWNRWHNRSAWRALLGETAGGDHVDWSAAPSRADDLSGLPPTLVQVGELDLFRDEDVAHAQRLLQAGVPTELHVYPGAFHGWDVLAPGAPSAVRARRERIDALRHALH